MDQGAERLGENRGHFGLRPVGVPRGATGLILADAPHDQRAKRLFGESVATPVVGSASLHNPIELTGRRAFYAANDVRAFLPEGLTIDEMLVAVSWPEALRPFTVVYIGGMEVLEARWCYTRPKRGHKIFVGVRPAGKGGGKKILTLVATIAIMVAAWYAAPLIAGALGFAAYGAGATAATIAAGTASYSTASLLIAGGLSMVGSLAMGALVKPPSAGGVDLSAITQAGIGSNIGSSNATPGKELQSYGLTSASNTAKSYSPVPKVLGRHRVTPNLAAETYVIAEGGVQTAYMLLDFGEGPTFINDIRIGTTPIDDYAGVEYRWHPYYQNGDALTFYSGDQATSKIEVSIERDVVTERTVPQSADTINVEIQAPSGLIAVDGAGNRITTTYLVEIYIAEGAQPWIPVRWTNPGILFRGDQGVGQGGFSQVGALGTVSADPQNRRFRLAYFQTVPTIGMSVLLTDGAYYLISGVTLIPPDAENVPPKPWATNSHAWVVLDGFPSTETSNSMVQSSAMLSLFNTLPNPAIAGSWNVTTRWDINAATIQFSGKTQTSQSATISFATPYRANWRVQVIGRTEAFVGTTSINQLKWSMLRAGKFGNPVIPKSARSLLEVKITASENINGQISSFNALITSLVRLWDGILYPTRNPAHLVLEVLTGTAAVKTVPWNEINTDKFYLWALWCEAVSPQGDTRCTCDMIVDTRTTVGELVTLIASSGRAAITIVDGKYDVMMEDEPRVPVQMFTERNTIGSSATRTWVDQPHAVKVTYVDENTWERAETYAYADGYDANTATKFETLDLVGCVRGFQAWRDGRYYMAASQLRREMVDFQTDIESIVCARGDLVLYSHDVFYGGIGAKAMSTDLFGITTLDVMLDTTDYDHAQIRYSDGAMENLPVLFIEGDKIFSPEWLQASETGSGLANSAIPGTSGTPPTGWGVTNSGAGSIRSIPVVGVEDGIEFFDMNLTGTLTANRVFSVNPVGVSANSMPALLGQEIGWTFFIRTRNGIPPLAPLVLTVFELDNAGVILRSEVVPVGPVQVNGTLATARFSGSFRPTLATCRRLRLYYAFSNTTGQVLDYQLRVGNINIFNTATQTTSRIRNGDLMVLGKNASEVEEWIVETVAPADNLSAKITLIEYRPEILLADRGPIPPYVPPGGDGTVSSVNPVTNLNISYNEEFLDGRPIYRATLNWTPAPGVLASRYEVFDDQNSNSRLGVVLAPPFTFVVDRLSLPRPGGETREYWVETVTVRGRRAESAHLSQLWVPETNPPVLRFFYGNTVNNNTILFWEAEGTPDLDFYQIRFSDSTTERDWNKMTVSIERVSGIATSVIFLRRTGTYAIRATDTGGNWSDPLFTTVIIDYPEYNDAYATLTKGAGWAGTFDRTEVVGGNLQLVGDALEGWWYASSTASETEAWRFRTTGQIDASVTNSQAPNDWNAEIWISSQGSSPKLNSAWFTPLSTAVPLGGTAGAYQPIRGLQTTDVDAILVRWAVRLSRTSILPEVIVSDASLILVNSTRIEFGNDVTVPDAGLTIYFQRKFFRIPQVQIAFDNFDMNAPNGAVTRITKDVYLDRFIVQGFDKLNNPQGGLMDWQAMGYGREAQ